MVCGWYDFACSPRSSSRSSWGGTRARSTVTVRDASRPCRAFTGSGPWSHSHSCVPPETEVGLDSFDRWDLVFTNDKLGDEHTTCFLRDRLLSFIG